MSNKYINIYVKKHDLDTLAVKKKKTTGSFTYFRQTFSFTLNRRQTEAQVTGQIQMQKLKSANKQDNSSTVNIKKYMYLFKFSDVSNKDRPSGI